MDMFAYIKEGKIEQISALPRVWGNVSNFDALSGDLAALKRHGWLPVQTISENKPIQTAINYLVDENCVKEIIDTRDLTAQEIEEENNSITLSKWSSIRIQRNNLLRESDLDVVSDKWEQMSGDLKALLSAYRQELRDLPQKFSTPDDVVWPSKP